MWNIRKDALLLSISLLVTACVHLTVQTNEPLHAGLGLEPGDRVVARWQDSFFEATVITVQSKLVTIAWDSPPPEKSMLPRDWIQLLEVNPARLRAGDWVLCPGVARQSWELCHVDEARGEGVSVTRVSDGVEQQLSIKKLVAIPDALYEWAASFGQNTIEKVRLSKSLSGLTPLTAGEPVTPGQDVLAKWTDGNWWRGTVDAIEGGSISVRWVGYNEGEPIPTSDVAPLHTERAEPAAGDRVLCEWMRGSYWWGAQVEGKSGTELSIVYGDGTNQILPAYSCIKTRRKSRRTNKPLAAPSNRRSR